MSLLEQQMRDLKLKQRKAAFLKVLLGLLDSKVEYKDEKPSKEEIEADKEIAAVVMNFIQDQINHIENGTPLASEEAVAGQFSSEEVASLKEMVARFTSRAQAEAAGPMERPAQPGQFRPQPPQPPSQKPRGNKDMLSFAMEHKHLNNKRVIVHTRDGKIGGVVTGAEMPNLWVLTDTGHRVPVLPENLTLE